MCKKHNEIDIGNAIFNGVCPVCLREENKRLSETIDILKSALYKIAWETPVSDVNFSWQREWHSHRISARDALKKAGFETESQREFRQEKIKQNGCE